MDGTRSGDMSKVEEPPTPAEPDSASSETCVIVEQAETHEVPQVQVVRNDSTEAKRFSALHQLEQDEAEKEGGESSVSAEPRNASLTATDDFKGEHKSDELASGDCFQFIVGSVPGSCETESSRSSPSNDGHSSVDFPPVAGGRPRSSSQDSKRSTKSKSGNGLRRGKWTLEEENYVARVIQDFNSGFLDAPAGTTLRTYLSEKLQCDPMRITKKFTGDACIGKRVFHPAVRSPSNAAAIDRAQVRL